MLAPGDGAEVAEGEQSDEAAVVGDIERLSVGTGEVNSVAMKIVVRVVARRLEGVHPRSVCRPATNCGGMVRLVKENPCGGSSPVR